MYTAAKFAKMVGVTVKCLQRWDRIGKLKALRTSTNRRYYTKEHLLEVLPTSKAQGRTVAYCRVSSQAQKADLKNQRSVLEDFSVVRGLAGVDFIEEIGGGLNMRRPKFLQILAEIETGEIDRLLVAHKDRLCRFGFELVEEICKRRGCELLVLNQEKLSPEQELVQDLMAITHCFSSRLYGLRNYRKSLKEALKQ
jgi:predicted site-specific integrase-resolvase